MKHSSPERLMAIGLAVCVVALVAVLAIGFGTGDSGATATRSPVASVASASPEVTTSPAETLAGTMTPWPTATPTAAPTSPLAFPGLLAAIGDSYTQAWSVSPSYKYDHPQFSWAVGYAKGDGVFSLQERFNALGARPVIMDAATSGRKMNDATRQATIVVAAAKKLPAGSTAFVTFELGTNDLCDIPMTDAVSFEKQLRASVEVLRAGLPPGSRILMLSVPDFDHFRTITQANATARAALTTRRLRAVCPPFLGTYPTVSLAQARTMLAAYDAVLYKVCDEVEAGDGAAGKLHCRHNEAALSEKDFKLADLSTADYFHPSLSGQARMAAAAWGAAWWSDRALPSGAAALLPGEGGSGAHGDALAAMSLLAPLGLGRWRGWTLGRAA